MRWTPLDSPETDRDSLFHLILLTHRVITFIVNLNSDDQPSPLGQWMYSKGYSTAIAIYFISGCLSVIGFGMMLFAYDFLVTFASGSYRRDGNIWAAHSAAGFDVLTIMVGKSSSLGLKLILMNGKRSSSSLRHGSSQISPAC